MPMQNRPATFGFARRQAVDRFQDWQARGQLHLAPHRVEIEPRIDERVVEVEENGADHGEVVSASG